MRLPLIIVAALLNTLGALLLSEPASTTKEPYTPITLQDAATPPSGPAAQARIVDVYGKLPLAFERNDGQTDPEVKFLSRGAGYTIFLTPKEAVMALAHRGGKEAAGVPRIPNRRRDRGAGNAAVQWDVVRMKLVDANPAPAISGWQKLPGAAHYLIGSDPAQWQTDVALYRGVRYSAAYPGIDLIYRGNPKQLEYDFIVAPGADPSKIVLEFDGVKAIEQTPQGDLLLTTPGGRMLHRKPLLFQETNGRRVEVAGRFKLLAENRVAFEVERFDPQQALVIDPILQYSSYLGGTGSEIANAIAIDAEGNAYVTGRTLSSNFPRVGGLPQGLGGSSDVFITKIDPAGAEIVFSTYLGGFGTDSGEAIALHAASGSIFVGGLAGPNFPTTPGSFSRLEGFEEQVSEFFQQGFVTRLAPAGNLIQYSTYVFNELNPFFPFTLSEMAVDGSARATFVGTLEGFIDDVFRQDVVVGRLNDTGAVLEGFENLGSGEGFGIDLDGSGNIYVTGSTTNQICCGPVPATSGAFQTAIPPTPGGEFGDAAFVTKLNQLFSVVYSTYLGGDEVDVGAAIAVDSTGSAYVAGFTQPIPVFNLGPAQTLPRVPFPTTANAFDRNCGVNETPSCENADVFFTKLNPQGSALVYSTLLGGASFDVARGIGIDGGGNAYITGLTGSLAGAAGASTGFPLVDAFDTTNLNSEGFIAKVNPAASGVDSLVYSSFIGGGQLDTSEGIAVDSLGSAYLAGGATSADFPTTPDAFQPEFGGGETDIGETVFTTADAFVAKVAADCLLLLADPNPLAFGFVPVGSSRQLQTVITLSRPVPAGSVLINTDAAEGTIPTFRVIAAAGLSNPPRLRVTVDFTPLAETAFSGTFFLRIAGEGLECRLNLDVNGTAVPPLQADPDTITYTSEEVTCGEATDAKTLVITNNTLSLISGISVQADGRILVTPVGDFSLNGFALGPPGSTTQPSSRTLNVVYRNPVEEPLNATIQFRANNVVALVVPVTAPSCEAQQILLSYQLTSGGETTALLAGGTIPFPGTLLGENSQVQLTVLNESTTAVEDLAAAVTAGASDFTVTGGTAQDLAGNASRSFTITFNPTADDPETRSGVLRLSGLGLPPVDFPLQGLVLAPAPVELTYLLDTGAGFASILPGSPITFPATTLGESSQLQFRVANASESIAENLSAAVTAGGAEFTLSNGAAQNLPGGANRDLTITFTPNAVDPELRTGVLQVLAADLSPVTFPLRGQATALTISEVEITGIELEVSPAQSPLPAIGIEVAEPVETTIVGTVRLTVDPESDLPDDTLVQFLGTGSREIQFTIPEGETQARFEIEGNPTEATYQSGTIASQLTFEVLNLQTANEAPVTATGGTPTATTRVPSGPPVIEQPTCTRAGNQLTVIVRGFSPNVAVTAVNFSMTAAGGSDLTFTPPNANFANEDFAEYYGTLGESTDQGSTFELRIPVTFQGDFSALGSASVSIANAANSTSQQRTVTISSCQ